MPVESAGVLLARLPQASFRRSQAASVGYGDKAIKIYLLLEHKSYPDRWVNFQLLRYLVRIWEQHRKQNHRDPWLPPIIPQATERLDEQDVIDLLTTTPQGEEIMPTFIDRYIEQGVQKRFTKRFATRNANPLPAE